MGFRGSIRPHHFQVDALVKASAAMQEDRFETVVIDDFLEPSLVAGLTSFFGQKGIFKEHYALKQPLADANGRASGPMLTVERSVSEADFISASDQTKLARELLLQTAPPENVDSVAWRAHVQFLDLLVSAEFKSYLSGITGAVGLHDVAYMARTMRFNDMCSAHSDAGDGRALCMLLYIGDGWQPGFGGRFQQVDQDLVARSTDPINNRLILHKPAPNQIHQVEPISEAGKHWLRHAYSVWFGSFPDKS